MRTIKAIVVGLAISTGILTAVLPMQGCSITQEMTPERVFFESQEAFIVLATNAIQAKRDGRINQSDWNTIWNPSIQQGNDLLDQMQAAYLSGDFESFNFAREALVSVVEIIKGGSQ